MKRPKTRPESEAPAEAKDPKQTKEYSDMLR